MPYLVSAGGLRATVLLLLSFALPLATQAQFVEATDRIGWNFTWDGTQGDLSATDVAGMNDPTWGDFRQDNWNNDPTLGQQASPGDPDIADLIDATGAATGASLDWSYKGGVNSWHMEAPVTLNSGDPGYDPNQKLTYGYQALDPQLKITNIPYDCYALVLYYNHDGTDGRSEIDLSAVGGSVFASRTVQAGGTPTPNANGYQNVGFVVEDGVAPLTSTNVTVFYGLRVADLQVDFTWLTDGSNGNTGTQALQIVDMTAACIFADGFESGNISLWM